MPKEDGDTDNDDEEEEEEKGSTGTPYARGNVYVARP